MNEWLLPLQTVINEALRYDLGAQSKLDALTGKTLVLAVTEPSIAFSLTFEESQFVFLQSGAIEPFDAKVSGKAADLFAVLRAKDRTAAMMEHDINIQGDTRTFFAIQELMSTLDIDWEMALGDRLGDVLAHAVADGLRWFGSVAKNHFVSFERTSRNFFREESGLFVQSDIWQSHQYDIQQMRQDVERVAAKIRRLDQRLAAKTEEPNE